MRASYIRLLIFQVAILAWSGLSAQSGDLKIEMTVTPTLSPCMEAVRLEFRVENVSSAAFSPVELGFGLPTGMAFVAGTEQGVSFDVESELTAPVFALPALPAVAPFGFVAFSFDIRTACDLTTASRPIDVVLRYDGEEYARSIDNLNLRIPALAMVGSSQLTYTGVPGETFTRSVRLRVANIGDIYNLYIISDHEANGVAFVSSNVPTTAVTLPDGRAARLVDRAYFDTFGNGDGAFNIADSTLVYEETVRIEGCNGGAGLIRVAYGCDGDICSGPTVFEPTNVIVNRETTELSWSVANGVLPGFCSPGSFTVTLTNNTGGFMARDLILEPGLVSLFGNPNNAGRSDCILFTGFSINGTALGPDVGSYSGYGLDLAQLLADPDGAGGLVDADGDGRYNDLPPGASIELVIQVELAEGCLGENLFFGRRFGMTTYFNDGCSASSDIRMHQNSSAFNLRLSSPEVSDNLQVEYADGDEVNVLFSFRRTNSSASANTFLSACAEGETVYRIVVPRILDFPADFEVQVNGSPAPHERFGDTVVVRVPGYTAQIHLNLIVACNVTVDNSEFCPIAGSLPRAYRFAYQADYYCDVANCERFYRLYSGNSSPFVVDCDEPPAGSTPGVKTRSFTARRLTLGWTDSSLSEYVNPNSPGIRLDRAYRYDLVKFTVAGQVAGAGIFDTSYFDLVHYSGRNQPNFYAVADTLHFYDSETSEWLSCPTVLSDSTASAGGVYSYYYSMAPLFQPGGCLAGRHLTGGDSLRLEVIARIDGYVPRELEPINLLGAGINYVVSQDTFRCGRHGAAFSTADPSYVFEAELRNSRLSCDTLTMVYNLSQGVVSADPFDIFPNEFRPYAVFDSIRAVIPASLDYVPNSTRVVYQYYDETSEEIQLDTVMVPAPLSSTAGEESVLRFYNNMAYPNVDVLRRGTRNELSFQVVPNCIVGQKYVQSRVFADVYRYAKESGFSRTVERTAFRNSTFQAPERLLNVVTPEYTGSSDTARWQVEVCVRPSGNLTETIAHNWLTVRSDGLNIVPLQARDVVNPQQVFDFLPADSSGLYWARIDTLIGGRCRLFELTALVENCDTAALNLDLGYACHAYPLHPDSAYQQCGDAQLSAPLYVIPRPARLDIGTVVEPNGLTPLCEPIEYEFTIINGEVGSADSLEVLLFINTGVGVVPGSCALQLGNGSYMPIPDPAPDAENGNLRRWLLSEYPGSPLFGKELGGFSAAPDNILHLRFQMETDCDYRPESTIRYAVQWRNQCSDAVNSSTVFFGQPLSLVGAPTEKNTYTLAIEQATATNACVAALPVQITLTNQGGTSSGLTFAEEQIKVILPVGAQYQPGSYVAVENMPVGVEPEVVQEGTAVALLLPMLPGVAVGGALSFQIELSIDTDTLANCGLYPLIVETRQVSAVPCVTADMGLCDLSFLSSRNGAALEVVKNVAAFSGASIQAAIHTAAAERWSGQAALLNQGALPLGDLTQVHLYLDLDGDGLFDPDTDSLLYTQSINAEGLAPAASMTWDFDLLMAGVHTCHGVHLVLERGINCLCADASIYLPPPSLRNAGPDHRLCRDENTTLGQLPMTGYTYQWSPAEHLNDAALASPAFLNDNLAAATGQALFAYTLETIRPGGCTSTDTLTVEVRNLQVQLTSLTDYNGYEVRCAGHTDGQIGATPSFGYAPLVYTWSTGHTAGGMLEDLGAGSYSLTVTDAEGCTTTDTQVLQEPLPLAVDLSPADYNGYNTSCHLSADGQITAAAQGGVGGYTYAWPGSGQADSLLMGLAAGTYPLLVTDGNGCNHTDSITLTSPPPLVAVDTLLTQPLCYGGTNGAVALTFTGGVPPYSYDGAAIAGTTLLDTSLGAGTYSYVLTDQNNCPYTGTFSMEEQVSTFELAMQPVRCHGETSGSITAEAVTGFPPYQWAWSDGQTQPLALNLPAGSYELSITDGNGCPYLLVAQVEEPPLLGANVSGTDALCHGSHNGTLGIVVSGGTPSYGIQVNGSEAGANVSDLPAGQYVLLVVDANGCAWDSVAIVQQPLPLEVLFAPADYNGYNTRCHLSTDGQITAAAQGGIGDYTYTWLHSGQADSLLMGLAAGTYPLLVTDGNGCTHTDSITLTSPPPLVAVDTLLTQPLCYGGTNGAVALTFTGGVPPYSYDGAAIAGTTLLDTSLGAGTYSYVLTDQNNCPYTGTFSMEEQVSTFELAMQPVRCHGEASGSLAVEAVTGFPPYEWAWSDGQTQPLALNLLAGSYELSITDGNGCPYLLAAEVTEPPRLGAVVDGTDARCHGSADGTLSITAQGGVPGYAIQVNGVAVGAEVGGLPAGQYPLLVMDGNGCEWDSTAFIGQPLPLVLSVDTLVAATCHGYSDGRIAVSAQGGTPPYQYQWGHGASGAALSGLPAAGYSLLITDAQGCLLADSITVVQPELPQPFFLLTEPTCFGDKDGRVAISGEDLQGYRFGLDSLHLQDTPAFEALPAGDYTLFLRNDEGCIYSYPFVLPSPPERFIEVLRDQTIKLGDSTEIEVRSLFPLVDIDWSGGDSIRCHDCAFTYVRPIYTQEYVVQVISDKGCFNEGEVRIVVDRRDPIYAPTAFSPNGDGANDQFTLFGGSAAVRIESLQIFDRWGNQLFRTEGIPLNDLSSGWDGTFRGRPMSAGVYVFQARVRLVDGSVEERKGEVNLVR